ncbi:nucleocapsid protein [Drosophila ananassae sigmavirus]|uniref:Nucleoprotein n=1 Tax=Drosophila ananassae sigmavirus TaxID=1002359 RepID=A0A140D8K5_9RHAB|nr:nucleocapsid protein [Drosophila ananassae sigmavirus]AMK09229.1 nucleocapsid protein [Drosophila ananassae sigmavirus]
MSAPMEEDHIPGSSNQNRQQPITKGEVTSSSIYKVTKEKVEFSSEPTAAEAVYPSAWFNNTKTKPTLIIPQCPPGQVYSVEVLRLNVVEHLLSGTLTKDIAMLYVYTELSRIEGTLSEDWTSFGVRIGLRDEKVTPFSPVTVKQEGNVVHLSPKSGECQYAYWALASILSVYRLSRTSYADYRSRMSESLKGQSEIVRPATALGYDEMSITYGAWKDDQNFRKMIATIDMFYVKFPGLQFDLIRFGTVSSRYKDCAALTSLFNLKHTMGVSKESQISLWIGNEVIANQFIRITKPGEEIDKVNSYFPYLIDFGLTIKSPYSSVLNANFYFFANTAAILMGNTRARNAVYHEIDSSSSTLMNSVLLGYAHAGRSMNSQMFFQSEEDLKLHEENSEMREALKATQIGVRVATDKEPEDRDASDWFDYMDKINWTYTDKMKLFNQSIKRTLADCRDGSLGNKLKALLPVPENSDRESL